ncbi:MAG: 2-phospho-L-lactate guanylyltransferase [Chloroflexales bacterium]|nr:2-phospho-L-lactate guanylyltransferase [Chloroflexales bacterium]
MIIHAVVPVKNLPHAKSRLAELLTPEERRTLVLAMLSDVLATLHNVPAIAHISLISYDSTVLSLAKREGYNVIYDHAADLNGALTQAAHASATAGADALLIVPADVPLVTPAEIDQVINKLANTSGVVLASSYDGGTNALLVRPPQALPFHFGSQSLALHQHEAQDRGLCVHLLQTPGLERDIDRPADLIALADTGGTTATQQLLRDLKIFSRIN